MVSAVIVAAGKGTRMGAKGGKLFLELSGRPIVAHTWQRFDEACPIDYGHYSIEHLQLDSAYRGNFAYAEYQSGHTMYLNLPDLKKMQRDLEEFIRQ